MNKYYFKKSRDFTFVKQLLTVSILIVLFQFTVSHKVMGQDVTAIYDKAKETLTITNNSNTSVVVLFNKEMTVKNNKIESQGFSVSNAHITTILPCGLNFKPTMPGTCDLQIQIRRSATIPAKELPNVITYYYCQKSSENLIIKNKGEIKQSEIQVTKVEEVAINPPPQKPEEKPEPSTPPQTQTQPQTQSQPQTSTQTPTATPTPTPTPTATPTDIPGSAKPPTKKTEVKQEVKKPGINPYTAKVDALVALNFELLTKDKSNLSTEDQSNLKMIEEDFINLRKEIENEKTLAEERKKNKKVKCTDCDELIKVYRELEVRIDEYTYSIHKAFANFTEKEIANLKKEYCDHVLQTYMSDSIQLLKIKKAIEKRSNHYLVGWIGVRKVKDSLAKVLANYEQIKEKSVVFINQKLQFYSDPPDRILINDLNKEIPAKYNEITDYHAELDRIAVPYVIIIVTAILILLLLSGILFYVRIMLGNKKIKRIAQEKKDAGESGLLIEEDDTIEVISYNVDLTDVIEKTGTDYYEVDMLQIADDTSIRKVYLHRKAIMGIYQFFSDFSEFESNTNETGCFLVGRWDFVPNPNQKLYDITIDTVIEPGDDAVYGEYTLNFGAKIGITLTFKIELLCERTNNEYVHTAWMHSHPGLGLFLSSQDLNVQSQLAHSQHRGRLLAIVLDSKTPDLKMAFFTPKKNGTMNNDKDMKLFLSLEEMYQWAKSMEASENK